MKKRAPSVSATPSTHSTAAGAAGKEGEGAGKIPQSTVKLLRPDQVWQPRIGAPYGNRNALTRLGAIRRQIRDLKRRARAALKAIP